MNLVFLQRLDRSGGGSRASLSGTLRALREQRPDWSLTLTTQKSGPMVQKMMKLGIHHQLATLPRFRKILERPAFWRDCRTLAAALAERAPDAIVSNEWVTAPHTLSVSRKLQIPAISYVRDFAATVRGRKYQLHQMDRLLCVCESMRQGLIQVGYDPEKVHTVYNPIYQPELSEPEDDVRDRISRVETVDRWMLYLGRLSSRKNQVAAVETLKLLRERSGQRWGLILAGDQDDTYVPAIDQAIASAGLNKEVLRLGLVPNPGWLFDLADASILTSKSEGLARVLIESFLCGKPAFAYPIGGLEDIYGSDIKNFVADSRDPTDLATTIIDALADSPALHQRTTGLKQMLEARHSTESHLAAFEQAVRFQ